MVEKLAVEGGPPVRRSKFPEYHAIADQREIRTVTRTLKSGTWRRGPVVEQCERDLQKYFRVKHALAVSDGL